MKVYGWERFNIVRTFYKITGNILQNLRRAIYPQ